MQHIHPIKHSSQILGVIVLAFALIACAGPKVTAYKTEPQKFNWGSAYVWMSTLNVNQKNANSGEGHLLINTHYEENLLNKNCSLTVKHVTMINSDGDQSLIDQAPLTKSGAEMSKKIIGHRTGQFSLSALPFEFDRATFPYDLNIKLKLDCPDVQTEHNFTKPIKFRMVQPLIWNQ